MRCTNGQVRENCCRAKVSRTLEIGSLGSSLDFLIVYHMLFMVSIMCSGRRLFRGERGGETVLFGCSDGSVIEEVLVLGASYTLLVDRG